MKLNNAVAWILCPIVGVIAFISLSAYYSDWSSRRRHATEIERGFADRLLPATAFVRGFVGKQSRLPTDDELEQAGWKIGTIGGGRDAYIHLWRERQAWSNGWGVPGKDFLVETAVPGWNLYYRSWDNKRVEASWP